MMKTTLLLLTSLLIVSCAGGFTAHAQDAPAAAQPGSSARVQMDPYTTGKLITVLDQVARHRHLSTGHMIDVVSA